jgi:hypothetical protein
MYLSSYREMNSKNIIMSMTYETVEFKFDALRRAPPANIQAQGAKQATEVIASPAVKAALGAPMRHGGRPAAF